MAKTEKNEGVAARIFHLDGGDRVVATNEGGGKWQPTYEEGIAWGGTHFPKSGRARFIIMGMNWRAYKQSTSTWTLAGLKALCARPADEVRAALVGNAS